MKINSQDIETLAGILRGETIPLTEEQRGNSGFMALFKTAKLIYGSLAKAPESLKTWMREKILITQVQRLQVQGKQLRAENERLRSVVMSLLEELAFRSAIKGKEEAEAFEEVCLSILQQKYQHLEDEQQIKEAAWRTFCFYRTEREVPSQIADEILSAPTTDAPIELPSHIDLAERPAGQASTGSALVMTVKQMLYIADEYHDQWSVAKHKIQRIRHLAEERIGVSLTQLLPIRFEEGMLIDRFADEDGGEKSIESPEHLKMVLTNFLDTREEAIERISELVGWEISSGDVLVTAGVSSVVKNVLNTAKLYQGNDLLQNLNIFIFLGEKGQSIKNEGEEMCQALKDIGYSKVEILTPDLEPEDTVDVIPATEKEQAVKAYKYVLLKAINKIPNWSGKGRKNSIKVFFGFEAMTPEGKAVVNPEFRISLRAFKEIRDFPIDVYFCGESYKILPLEDSMLDGSEYVLSKDLGEGINYYIVTDHGIHEFLGPGHIKIEGKSQKNLACCQEQWRRNIKAERQSGLYQNFEG